MALIQTEMNVVNSGGTSDVIVPNAIANNDGTSSGFSQDANNVLKLSSGEVVRKIIPILTTSYSTYDTNEIDISSFGLSNGDKIEFAVAQQLDTPIVYRTTVGSANIAINTIPSSAATSSNVTIKIQAEPSYISISTTKVTLTKGKVLNMYAAYNNDAAVKLSSSSPIITNALDFRLLYLYKIIE